jgi:Protein of unknown function (DUF1656)
MRFAEIDLFGVYVAPISLMMVGAWLATIVLRRAASRSGLLRSAEHSLDQFVRSTANAIIFSETEIVP